MSTEPVFDTPPPSEPRAYEPPRIELHLTPEALEREILYAGEPPSQEA
jgi:hypothetical protein